MDDAILKLLTDIQNDLAYIKRRLDESDPGIRDDVSSWSVALLHEHVTGSDIDGNNEIYGHTFIFNQEPESMPPGLKGVQNEMMRDWKGKTITLVDFIGTLPDSARQRQVIRWVELVREQRRIKS